VPWLESPGQALFLGIFVHFYANEFPTKPFTRWTRFIVQVGATGGATA
jgi:hypothetical protein